MVLILKDRVKETTTTTGTGTYTLAGAVTGFQAFSVIGDGNTTYYEASDGTNWETGIGTYTLSGTTLARTTILSSSNANAAVSWGAGSKTIWCDLPANRLGIAPMLSTASTFTLDATSNGKRHRYTGSSSITPTFTAAATLGDGWSCIIENAGTSQATITLDPNSTELIDGLTSYKMYPGEVRLINCDGTGFTSVVLHGFRMVYSATTTGEPVPPGYKFFNFDAVGGGGSGGVRSTTGLATGGAGGAHDMALNIPAGLLGTTWDATVGAGGAAVASGNANGNAGGESKLVSNSITWVDAFGGGGGSNDSNVANSIAGGGGGGTGAVGSGGAAAGSGNNGGAAQVAPNLKPYVLGAGATGAVAAVGTAATDGGASGGGSGASAAGKNGGQGGFGGSGGGGTSSGTTTATIGGSSLYLNSVGGGVSTAGVPSAATGVGAGGGAGRAGSSSGAGTAGQVVVTGII